MELEIQKYLRGGGTLESLKETLGIKATRSNQSSQLISLKYDQIDSPSAHPIVVECRGIILDESDNWRVRCYSFNRFFNIEEGKAATLDWESVKIQSKLDGSLVRLFYYNGAWRWATSGNPDAAGEVGYDSNISFKNLIERTFEESKYIYPEDINLCFTFELTSPYNTVVVNYPESRLTLLSVRDLSSLNELDPAPYAAKYNWKCIGEETLIAKHPEQVKWAAANVDGSKEEGYVCVDKNFNRVKVKSPQYVLLHRFKSSLSKRNLFEIALINEQEEVVSYFPEYKEDFDKFRFDIENLLFEVAETYGKLSNIESQKEFALAALKYKYSGALFSKRKNPDILLNHLIRTSKAESIWKMLYKTDTW
jgi:hypothetical protein